MVSVRNSKKRFEKGERGLCRTSLLSFFTDKREEKGEDLGAAGQADKQEARDHQHKQQLSTMVQITNI